MLFSRESTSVQYIMYKCIIYGKNQRIEPKSTDYRFFIYI